MLEYNHWISHSCVYYNLKIILRIICGEKYLLITFLVSNSGYLYNSFQVRNHNSSYFTILQTVITYTTYILNCAIIVLNIRYLFFRCTVVHTNIQFIVSFHNWFELSIIVYLANINICVIIVSQKTIWTTI